MFEFSISSLVTKAFHAFSWKMRKSNLLENFAQMAAASRNLTTDNRDVIDKVSHLLILLYPFLSLTKL